MSILQIILGPCQEWTGKLNRDGYGITYVNGKAKLVHRLIMGEPSKKIVMHLCNNPGCINIDHLKVGTPKENSEYMVLSKRQSSGANRPAAKFTENQIKHIRAEGKGHFTYKELAKKWDCSESAIYFVLNNITYKESNCEYLKEYLDLGDGEADVQEERSGLNGKSES